MAKKQNEIIEEQRRAREEFIRLKKMQNGELEPEAKPSETMLKPTTFLEKLKNFWFHYKVHTIFTVIIAAVLTVAISQCASRPDYDLEIMYFAHEPALNSQTDKIAQYFSQYVTDVNGDGEVKVAVKNCSTTDDKKDNSRFTIYSKVQSIIINEEKVVVYIVDDKAVKYFNEALDYSIFAGETVPLGEDFYKATELKDLNYKLPEGLSVGLRIVDGTALEGNEDAEKAFKLGEKVIEKIKKQAK